MPFVQKADSLIRNYGYCIIYPNNKLDKAAIYSRIGMIAAAKMGSIHVAILIM